MKIDVYTTIYNEDVILPYFLRHYESFAQRIFVFFDKSPDNSEKILRQHPKVTLFELKEHGINEGYWTSQIWTRYEEFSRGKADYVICVDADEFVYHPHLIKVLEQEKKKGTLLIKPEGFIMFSETLPTTSGQIYEEIKDGIPDAWSCKSIIFDPEIYIRYRKGRHGAARARLNGVGVSVEKNTGLKLLHYRYLGKEYFEKRDRRNFSRYYIGVTPPPYNMNLHHQLPDRTKGNRYEWAEKHKLEAVNVVDYG